MEEAHPSSSRRRARLSLAITQANTISDTITVPDSGTATSVSVAVDVTHTYIGDLKIDLVAPDGTTKTASRQYRRRRR